MHLFSDFPEHKKLLSELVEAKKVANRKRRKVKNFEKSTQCFLDMFSHGRADKELEIDVKNAFELIGFKRVEHLGNNSETEDILISDFDMPILIEVTGNEGASPQDKKVGQVDKFVKRFKRNPDLNDAPVIGIVVYNHQNIVSDPYKRKKMPFSERFKSDSINSDIGLLTTLDLFWAFKMIRKGEITFEDFNSYIRKPGHRHVSKKNLQEWKSRQWSNLGGQVEGLLT